MKALNLRQHGVLVLDGLMNAFSEKTWGYNHDMQSLWLCASQGACRWQVGKTSLSMLLRFAKLNAIRNLRETKLGLATSLCTLLSCTALLKQV